MQLREKVDECADGACASGEESVNKEIGAASEDGEFGRGKEGSEAVEFSNVSARELGANNIGVLGQGGDGVGVKVLACSYGWKVVDHRGDRGCICDLAFRGSV